MSDLGGPIRSIKTPVSIAIRVTEVCNPPKWKGDSTRRVERERNRGRRKETCTITRDSILHH